MFDPMAWNDTVGSNNNMNEMMGDNIYSDGGNVDYSEETKTEKEELAAGDQQTVHRMPS